MGVISFKHRGSFTHLERFLKKASKIDYDKIMRPYGEAGVRALESATPIDSGVTSGSWYYGIETTGTSISLVFNNHNINQGIPIVILIQYGHATRNGGYVSGIDFINPALSPIFDDLANAMWQEVNS